MKPWHVVALLVVGYLIGSYYSVAKLKAVVTGLTSSVTQ